MKSHIRILLILFCISYMPFLHSQDFWEKLYFPDSVSIRCIATNDLGHIFIGVGSNNETGGVYRSVNNAQSWDLVYNNGTSGIYSLTIDIENNIYVGKRGSNRLIVSKDNGDTWDNIILPPPSFDNIMKILCIDQDTIYVSTWESVSPLISYSFDSGETWGHSFVTNHHDEYVSDIAMSNTGELFVSVSGFFDNQGGVYKSVDYGASWEYVGLLNHQVLTIEINSKNDLFTGDWWGMNSDPFGIYRLYSDSDEFELALGAGHATDIVIDSEDIIYATANEEVVWSFDDGQNFYYIEDELSSNLAHLNISYDGFLYGARTHLLVKSIKPITTAIDTDLPPDFKKSICVYPNPVCNNLFLKIEATTNHTDFYNISIFDIYGKTVYKDRKNFQGDYCQLDVSQLSKGFYLIKIEQNREIFNASFIKK